MSDPLCKHLSDLDDIKQPKELVCDVCVTIGSEWLHLRTCQTCGQTHCCDDSPNKHATAHAQASRHPVAISAEPGERWAWCYVDEQITGY